MPVFSHDSVLKKENEILMLMERGEGVFLLKAETVAVVDETCFRSLTELPGCKGKHFSINFLIPIRLVQYAAYLGDAELCSHPLILLPSLVIYL